MPLRTGQHAALLAAATVVAAAGCARTVVEDADATDYDPNDVTAQLDFWHELPGASAVSNDEGLHGVILLLEGVDETGSYEERLAYFRERGWLPDGFDEPAEFAMQRGLLASVLTHALDVDGGVMMRLTNKHPRYATRELVALGVLPAGSELMVIDGLDYLGVISEAQDELARRELEALRDAADRPAESSE